MDIAAWLFTGLAFSAREIALFAAFGFLVLGTSDLVVDLLWLKLWLRGELGRDIFADSGDDVALAGEGVPAGFMAIFIPAWDEAGVAGQKFRPKIIRRATPYFAFSAAALSLVRLSPPGRPRRHTG